LSVNKSINQQVFVRAKSEERKKTKKKRCNKIRKKEEKAEESYIIFL
jgi:hypothetical protein